MRVTWKPILSTACLSLCLAACSGSGGNAATSTAGSGDGVSALTESSGGTSAGVVAGEGVGTTGGGTDLIGVATIPEIQGLWATRCLANEGGFKLQSLSVVGSRIRHESASFSDQDCTSPVDLGLPIEGATVQQEATTVSNATTRTTTLGEAIEVDFHFEDATIDNKPLSEDEFETREQYAARVEFNVVLVSENILYLGDTALAGYEGSSAATRPISLDTLKQYLFVPK